MKIIYTLPALIALASCAGGAGTNTSSGECETGAAQLQSAVGMEPDDALALVKTAQLTEQSVALCGHDYVVRVQLQPRRPQWRFEIHSIRTLATLIPVFNQYAGPRQRA